MIRPGLEEVSVRMPLRYRMDTLRRQGRPSGGADTGDRGGGAGMGRLEVTRDLPELSLGRGGVDIPPGRADLAGHERPLALGQVSGGPQGVGSCRSEIRSEGQTRPASGWIGSSARIVSKSPRCQGRAVP